MDVSAVVNLLHRKRFVALTGALATLKVDTSAGEFLPKLAEALG